MMKKSLDINYMADPKRSMPKIHDRHFKSEAKDEDSLVVEENTVYEVDLSCIQRMKRKAPRS